MGPGTHTFTSVGGHCRADGVPRESGIPGPGQSSVAAVTLVLIVIPHSEVYCILCVNSWCLLKLCYRNISSILIVGVLFS